MTDPDATQLEGRAVLRHPLRGLASDGAESATRVALAELDGILGIDVLLDHAVAEVVFDPRRVTREAIRDRLRVAGVRPDARMAEDGHGSTD